MPETHVTPFPELKKLMEIVEKHEQRLGRGNIEFAVISTKLNIIMAILAAVGVAVCGAVISIIL